MLICCGDGKQSRSSLACVHLIKSAGLAYHPFPRQQGEEGAPHMVCEDCIVAGFENTVAFLHEVCLDCARAIQTRHHCHTCLLKGEPCEYHGALGASQSLRDE
jgi:hypothetical protein